MVVFQSFADVLVFKTFAFQPVEKLLCEFVFHVCVLQICKEKSRALQKSIDCLQKRIHFAFVMSREVILKGERKKTEGPIRLAFPPEKYSKRVYALIVEKCQEWGCSPADAEARLLDELAAKREKKAS